MLARMGDIRDFGSHPLRAGGMWCLRSFLDRYGSLAIACDGQARLMSGTSDSLLQQEDRHQSKTNGAPQ
jgi:hypothetical protein